MIVLATWNQFVAALLGFGVLLLTMLGPKLLEYATAWLQVHEPGGKR